MPPRRNVPAVPESQPTTALQPLSLPDDVRADLLRAQAESITTAQRLPQVRVMPAAAGLYEFSDSNETAREFVGVVLNNHPRHILWDQPYGTAPTAPDGERPRPACVSPDGRTGTPREGFAHAALNGARATGTEAIACGSCPFNQWGSKHLVDSRGGKGKACTNQRSVYILMDGRAAPVELVLPPTSLAGFDEYLTSLLNRSLPIQAVFTTFTQVRKERGQLAWCQAAFAQGRTLTQEEFDAMMAKRQQWLSSITPISVQAMVAQATEAAAATPATAGAETDDSELPF